jgi:hypothetical protein
MVKLTTLKLLILCTEWGQTEKIEKDNSSTRIMRSIMKLWNLWIIPAIISNKNNKVNEIYQKGKYLIRSGVNVMITTLWFSMI